MCEGLDERGKPDGMAVYLRPETLGEATGALREWAGRDASLSIIAGGTDYYPARVGKPLDDDILDISAIGGLRGISDRGDSWRIGALATWTDVIRTALPACFDGLKLAAREVGGVQIQNAGTVCGNVCNASPAADGVPALMALDASVTLAGAGGERHLPLDRFVLGNRQTARRPDELVTGLSIPKLPAHAASTFLKLGARKYLVISIAMVAAVLTAGADGRVTDARVSVGACSPVARRLPSLESRLVGSLLADAPRLVAAADLQAVLSPIDDPRATAAYRLDAAVTLVRRALASFGAATETAA